MPNMDFGYENKMIYPDYSHQPFATPSQQKHTRDYFYEALVDVTYDQRGSAKNRKGTSPAEAAQLRAAYARVEPIIKAAQAERRAKAAELRAAYERTQATSAALDAKAEARRLRLKSRALDILAKQSKGGKR